VAEQDTQLNKYREKLLTAHSLEIEKNNERHRNEMKKYHVSSISQPLLVDHAGRF
jgi:hypothetical protein